MHVYEGKAIGVTDSAHALVLSVAIYFLLGITYARRLFFSEPLFFCFFFFNLKVTG